MQAEAKTIIEEINAYCASAGISSSTLCVRALGSSRFVERLQRKAEKFSEDAARIRAFIRDNPVPSDQIDVRGAAHHKTRSCTE